jgi:hypothetical protein
MNWSRFAMMGRRRVRVLSYTGDGYFDVLTSRDERYRVHRDRLVFLPRSK